MKWAKTEILGSGADSGHLHHGEQQPESINANANAGTNFMIFILPPAFSAFCRNCPTFLPKEKKCLDILPFSFALSPLPGAVGKKSIFFSCSE
jgi:hypothetical protein